MLSKSYQNDIEKAQSWSYHYVIIKITKECKK